MTTTSRSWDGRAEAYRLSATHRAGEDLDTLVEWCEPGPGVEALDVATGGGHVARRLREAGCSVVSSDSSPGMEPDVVCSAESLPFTEGSFDVVATRIAPHHFSAIQAAVDELARVTRDRVVVEDTLFATDEVEQAEVLRDPTHVRNYTEDDWRGFLERAGLTIERVAFFEKLHPLDDWLARTGCTGADASRVRELLADRTSDGAWRDTKILLLARKDAS